VKRHESLRLFIAIAALMVPQLLYASNHREAPITALDHKADITDLYAFVSYGPGGDVPKVTIILDVDPFLEPSNGPTWFPFDPDILYEIKIDNDRNALADVTFKFRFTTEYQLPGVFTALAGIGDRGAFDPHTGNLVVPPQIRDFNNPGLNLRQRYTVTVLRDGCETELTNPDGSPFFAVPANAGPRTIDYRALFNAGTYRLDNGVSVFAGTVDDPFWIDLGAAFDTVNFRHLSSGVPGVLTAEEDDPSVVTTRNLTSDSVSGFAVNAIAIEVPIEQLTRDGRLHEASSPDAVIGVWGTTSRPRVTVRRSPEPPESHGHFRQVQRIGNPLINELLIGIGSKDRFSMDQPANDVQFASFFLDPPIVHIVEALYGGALAVPPPPRTDLLPLVTYAPPICPGCGPDDTGPIADLLRLNTGIPATPISSASRLGFIGGDTAGFPNGRRLFDDVVDITLRVGVGGVLHAPFEGFNPEINGRLGDGVNRNDADYRDQFPYLADCPSGRNRRHIDPGEPGGGPIN